MAVYGFISMILAINAFAEYQKIVSQFDYIIAEFKNPPIVDMVALTGDCSA